jgi:hypothetical protein
MQQDMSILTQRHKKHYKAKRNIGSSPLHKEEEKEKQDEEGLYT